jgi:hypothetical protein
MNTHSQMHYISDHLEKIFKAYPKVAYWSFTMSPWAIQYELKVLTKNNVYRLYSFNCYDLMKSSNPVMDVFGLIEPYIRTTKIENIIYGYEKVE